MKLTPYDEIQDGEYYLIYSSHSFITICKYDESSDFMTTFKDVTPYLQLAHNSSCIIITINDPESTYVYRSDPELVFALDADEIYKHVLMETV